METNAAVPKLHDTRISFLEENVSDGRGGGWFQDDSSVLCLLCTLFQLLLYQLHLGSSGIRSQRLGVLYILPPDVGSKVVSLVLVQKRIKIAI